MAGRVERLARALRAFRDDSCDEKLEALEALAGEGRECAFAALREAELELHELASLAIALVMQGDAALALRFGAVCRALLGDEGAAIAGFAQAFSGDGRGALELTALAVDEAKTVPLRVRAVGMLALVAELRVVSEVGTRVLASLARSGEWEASGMCAEFMAGAFYEGHAGRPGAALLQ